MDLPIRRRPPVKPRLRLGTDKAVLHCKGKRVPLLAIKLGALIARDNGYVLTRPDLEQSFLALAKDGEWSVSLGQKN